MKKEVIKLVATVLFLFSIFTFSVTSSSSAQNGLCGWYGTFDPNGGSVWCPDCSSDACGHASGDACCYWVGGGGD